MEAGGRRELAEWFRWKLDWMEMMMRMMIFRVERMESIQV